MSLYQDMNRIVETRRLAALLPVSLLLLLLASCAPAPPAQKAEQATLTPTGYAPQDVVARVNGAPILRQDLLEQMRGGQRRDEALQALIKQELLAQEAARRGLTTDDKVLRTQRRAMVNLLIRRDFRRSFSRKDVPRELIEAAYKLNQGLYAHPELVEVYHIVVIANASHDEAYHARARRLAFKVHAIAAAGALSPKEFGEIAAVVNRDDPAIQMRAEGPLKDGRGGMLDQGFINSAFKLNKPGEISPVVQTPFGYHVIYLQRKIPAINVSLDQAESEIRDKIFDQARRQAFMLWLSQQEQRHQVVRMDPQGVSRPAAPAGQAPARPGARQERAQ